MDLASGNLGPQQLKAMILEWALAFRSGELGFCSGCLSTDRSASRPLSWRPSWLGAFSTHCLVHGRALAVLSADDVDAFSYARHWGFIDAGRLTSEFGERPVERDALQLQQAVARDYLARTTCVARSVGTCSTVRYPRARRSMPANRASP